MRMARAIPMLLTVASIVMLFVPGLARPEPQSQLDTFHFPWIWPPFLDPEVKQCWSSLAGVPRCWEEIFTSCFTLDIHLGPKCCNVINQFNENCIDNIFHVGFLNPFFPLLKDYCTPHDQSPTPIRQLAPSPSENVAPNSDSGIAQSPKGREPPTPDQEISPSPSEEDVPNPHQGEAPDASSPDQEISPSPSEEHQVEAPEASSPDQEISSSPSEEPNPHQEEAPDTSSPDQEISPSPSEENEPNPHQGEEPSASSPDEQHAEFSEPPQEADATPPDQGPFAGEADAPTSDESDAPAPDEGDAPESDQRDSPSPTEENVLKPKRGSAKSLAQEGAAQSNHIATSPPTEIQ